MKLKYFVASAFLLPLLCAQAEDIEIYSGIGSEDVNPNMLFVLDTSGSMRRGIAVAFSTFDNQIDYGNSNDDNFFVYDRNLNYQNVFYTRDQVACNAMLTFFDSGTSLPLFDDFFLQWNNGLNDWSDSLFVPSDPLEILECESDAGLHGIDDIRQETYVTLCPDGSCQTPRYTLSNPGVNFMTEGKDAFLVSANFRDYLESGVPSNNPAGNFSADVEDYCDNTNNIGDFVQEAPGGIVYECVRRVDTMMQVIRDLTTTFNDVNVGLARFLDSDLLPDRRTVFHDGGSIIRAVETIDGTPAGEASRADLLNTLNELYNIDIGGNNDEIGGRTPLMETLYETFLYYSGQPVLFGQTQLTDPSAVNGRDYVSPIENACQSNNVIYLSDGGPNSDGDSFTTTAINSLLTSYTPDVIADQFCFFDDFGGDSDGDNCMDELAEIMANYDHEALQTRAGATELVNNTVNTYTIGFATDEDVLEDAAIKGGGEYFIASDYRQLLVSFQNILTSISLSNPSTLLAPAVSVNAFNELQHRDDLYYSVFEPAATPKWQGNVKKYRIENGDILDANNALAIDSATGFFNETSQSFWSNQVDASNVPLGGIREQFTNNRRIFIDGAVLDTPQTGIVQLGQNDDLSPVAAGVGSDADAATIRDWILGEDVSDADADNNIAEAHQYAADSLHARPFVVTYEGTNTTNARDVLFVPTNKGFLHAIDARNNSGDELWSYIPESLLSNSTGYLKNAETQAHIYGLDGETTVYTEEAANSTPSNFALDTVQLFQGMRRGGRNYYAWDVSNALSTTGTPISEMWSIEGGVGDFANLGQTWSRMIRTQINNDCDADGQNCTSRDVLVFSGGYDTYYDDPTVAPYTGPSNVQGNAIYIVDANTGDLLWSAGDASDNHDLGLDMFNSIPASPTPIDINGDGAMETLFAVDISGKVWRIDFDQTAPSPTAGNFAQGGMIADLSSNQPTRFYNAIDASFIAPRGESAFFNLVVGSGYRAHPRDTDEDTNALFVIYDENVFAPRDDNNDGIYEYGYTDTGGVVSFANGDLFEVTQGNPAVRGVNTNLGFYFSFIDQNEKLLQSTTTLAGVVTFATYIPVGGTNQVELCGSGNIGSGRVYAVDLATGNIIFTEPLGVDGIPPDPTFLLTEQGGLTICIGTECFVESPGDPAIPQNIVDAQNLEVGTALRTYWREEQ